MALGDELGEARGEGRVGGGGLYRGEGGMEAGVALVFPDVYY